MLKRVMKGVARRLGYGLVDLSPGGPLPSDFDDDAVATIMAVREFSMTGHERLFALIEAVRYVVRHGIDGCIVECGVWRGGSMMAAALTLGQLGRTEIDLYLFDTFEGMTRPSERDISRRGKAAITAFEAVRRGDDASDWCYAPLDEVRRNLESTGYPNDRVRLVKGKVEETIPSQAPERIAILRLDTDWYESTLHELQHLYSRLVSGGVLIVDDYGHWHGCRQATDAFLAESGAKLLLSRIDYSGRIAVKP